MVDFTAPGVTRRPPKRRPPSSGRPPNYPWADLMKHSFGLDVLACPHCGGRLRHVATLHSPVAIRAVLQHVGEWADVPQRARGDPSATYELDEEAIAELPVDEDVNQDPGDEW